MQIPQRAVGPARGYRESLPRVQLPPLRHELFERLFAGVQRRELTAPLKQPQMGAEVERILWCVEVTAAALAMHVSKPNAVGPVRGAVAPLAVADLYTRDGPWSAGAHITDSGSVVVERLMVTCHLSPGRRAEPHRSASSSRPERTRRLLGRGMASRTFTRRTG